MSEKPTFGHGYKIKAYLRRIWRDGKKEWVRIEEPHIALYIGYRTLFNGKVEYYEDCTVFNASEHFQAYLFVIHSRSNPIYVLPTDVEL